MAMLTDPNAVLAWSFLRLLCTDGDLDEACDLLSADLVYWNNVTGATTNKSQLRRALAWRAGVVKVEFTLVRAVVDGDKVVIEAESDGTTTYGDRYNGAFAFVFEIRAAQIVIMREYCDTKLVADVLGRRTVEPGH